MANNPYYKEYGQGPAKPVDPFEQQLDEFGFTNPNLHRRTDISDSVQLPETSPREYQFGIYSLNSYKYKKLNYHDEESEISEIP